MDERICTSCEKPHVTRDWYVIEEFHARAGQIECAAAHEDRVRRETRERLDKPTAAKFGYCNSIAAILAEA